VTPRVSGREGWDRIASVSPLVYTKCANGVDGVVAAVAVSAADPPRTPRGGLYSALNTSTHAGHPLNPHRASAVGIAYALAPVFPPSLSPARSLLNPDTFTPLPEQVHVLRAGLRVSAV
jgi:hypothetical protein